MKKFDENKDISTDIFIASNVIILLSNLITTFEPLVLLSIVMISSKFIDSPLNHKAAVFSRESSFLCRQFLWEESRTSSKGNHQSSLVEQLHLDGSSNGEKWCFLSRGNWARNKINRTLRWQVQSMHDSHCGVNISPRINLNKASKHITYFLF